MEKKIIDFKTQRDTLRGIKSKARGKKINQKRLNYIHPWKKQEKYKKKKVQKKKKKKGRGIEEHEKEGIFQLENSSLPIYILLFNFFLAVQFFPPLVSLFL